ncbi:MAG: NAD(P)-binding domain-containing protein [Actinomycetota bacterium]
MDGKTGNSDAEGFDTVVIGGGQAGLSMGYQLAKVGRRFVILDASERIGDAWRDRWDSLRLFTPARLDGLEGMPFPAKGDTFISKDQMADYLESYAARFDLPVRSGVRVDGLSKHGDRFVVTAGDRTFEADNVVVAMASSQVPHLPAFAKDLDTQIVQLHSKDYRNPSQLREGAALVVGAGNSGADIALEITQHHPTWMAGEESGHIPFHIEGFVARHVLLRLVRFVGHRVLTVRTPIGRKARPKMLTAAAPLIRVKPKDLIEAGIRRVPRIAGIRDGLPVTEDGQALDVANVVWCTGFRPGFSWIHLPIIGDREEPEHERGVVPKEPGLYFVGLHFLYAMTSETVNGIARDTAYIAKQIASSRSADRAEISVAAGA